MSALNVNKCSIIILSRLISIFGPWRWYQGENEIFRLANTTTQERSDEERAEIDAKVEQYEQNLVEFVRDIRQEVYHVDTRRYESPEDIPFAIIQIGCWIRELNNDGLTIFNAQKRVADDDPKIVLVDTYNHLSCHYHLDDPSMLIIGHRLALQLMTLLKEGEPPQQDDNNNDIDEDAEEYEMSMITEVTNV